MYSLKEGVLYTGCTKRGYVALVAGCRFSACITDQVATPIGGIPVHRGNLPSRPGLC